MLIIRNKIKIHLNQLNIVGLKTKVFRPTFDMTDFSYIKNALRLRIKRLSQRDKFIYRPFFYRPLA